MQRLSLQKQIDLDCYKIMNFECYKMTSGQHPCKSLIWRLEVLTRSMTNHLCPTHILTEYNSNWPWPAFNPDVSNHPCANIQGSHGECKAGSDIRTFHTSSLIWTWRRMQRANRRRGRWSITLLVNQRRRCMRSITVFHAPVLLAQVDLVAIIHFADHASWAIFPEPSPCIVASPRG